MQIAFDRYLAEGGCQDIAPSGPWANWPWVAISAREFPLRVAGTPGELDYFPSVPQVAALLRQVRIEARAAVALGFSAPLVTQPRLSGLASRHLSILEGEASPVPVSQIFAARDPRVVPIVVSRAGLPPSAVAMFHECRLFVSPDAVNNIVANFRVNSTLTHELFHGIQARQMTWEVMDRFRTTAMAFVFEGTATAHGVAVLRVPRLPGQLLARPHPLLGWRNWRVQLDIYHAAEDLIIPGVHANQYMAYEFWLAVFDEWQPAAVESFFFRLAGQDPSLAGVSTAMMTADDNPGSLQAQFLRIGLERGRPLVPGIDGRVDDQTFLTRSESNGAALFPVMGQNPTLSDDVPRLGVHAVRLIRYEDLNLHVRSIRLQFSRPGGPDSRVVVEAVRDDVAFFRETFVDREIADFEFHFPDSPDPGPGRYWYEPLSIDVTIINGTLEEDSIHWTLTTVISTAGNL